MIDHPLAVGVVTPHTAPGPEVELPAMTSGRVVTVLSRTNSPTGAPLTPVRAGPPAHAELRASTELPALDRAGLTFKDWTLAAVAHASTTTGYLIGYRDEVATLERLSQRFGVPAVASCAAAVAALHTHEIGCIQLVHPAWIDNDFDELGRDYFRSQGIDATVTRGTDLIHDPARVEPHHVVDWVEHHLEDRAEAILLAGNGFRAAGAIHELEVRTDRLVLAANQALLWAILTASNTHVSITGYGRLLKANASTSRS